MTHFEMQSYQKGRLVSCECAKCGSSMFAHEWASWDFNQERDAMQEGMMRCQQCAVGRAAPDTFWESPKRNYYAVRYSAPGYLDCTDFVYDTNLRRAEKECRDLYGSN